MAWKGGSIRKEPLKVKLLILLYMRIVQRLLKQLLGWNCELRASNFKNRRENWMRILLHQTIYQMNCHLSLKIAKKPVELKIDLLLLLELMQVTIRNAQGQAERP